MATKKPTAEAVEAGAINEGLAHDSMLETLQQEAAQLDAPAEPAPAEVQAKTDSTAQDLFGILQVARAAARPAVYWQDDAQFNALWGDSTMQAIAEPLAEIMARHGLTMGDMVGRYAPYIALAGALAPPAIATIQGYKLAQAKPAVPAQTGGENAA